MTPVRRDDGVLSGDQAGFTVVELLVAMALFGILLTLVFGNLRYGVKAWQSGSAQAATLERDLVVQNLLRRLIGNAYPLYLGGGQPDRDRIDFEGTADTVIFLSGAPVVMGGGGRFRYVLSAERYQDRTDLTLTAAPELVALHGEVLSRKTVLLSDVSQVEFSYFGEEAPGQAARWHTSWVQRAEMPSRMRIRVTSHKDNAQAWPDLVIAPRLSVDAACVYDPVSMRCRGR